MYTKAGNHRVDVRENARGGKGKVVMHHLLEQEDLAPHSRLLGKIVIEPGNSMGFHTHHDEGEFFYILKGVARISDGSEETLVYPGDSFFTASGKSHSVEAEGDETLEYLALVLSSV